MIRPGFVFLFGMLFGALAWAQPTRVTTNSSYAQLKIKSTVRIKDQCTLANDSYATQMNTLRQLLALFRNEMTKADSDVSGLLIPIENAASLLADAAEDIRDYCPEHSRGKIAGSRQSACAQLDGLFELLRWIANLEIQMLANIPNPRMGNGFQEPVDFEGQIQRSLLNTLNVLIRDHLNWADQMVCGP